MRWRYVILGLIFVFVVFFSPFCCCMCVMERFLMMANPKETFAQKAKDWWRGE